MASFNLVDQRWIPCVMHDGRTEEMGIQDTLLKAAEIREVLDSSPLVTAALHRLLLAILHRNFGPESLTEWRGLWEHGRWDGAVLMQYLADWRPRFDLFDEDRPFYQVADIAADLSPIARLELQSASGNNPTLFDHSLDAAPTPVTAARAARAMLSFMSYAPSGGNSAPFNFCDSPLTRGFTVLALGDHLFETLALNLMPYNLERPISVLGQDIPLWEQDGYRVPDPAGTMPSGYLDYLTWPSRKILLVPQGDPPTVQWCRVRQHLKVSSELLDPLKCFERSEKGGLFPRPLDSGRALWRDCHVLFQQVDKSWKRPDLFNWLARIDGLRRAGVINAKPQYACSLLGCAVDSGQAKVLFWRHERLPLPLQYLSDSDLVNALREGLAIADRVGNALTMAAYQFALLTVVPQWDLMNAVNQKKAESKSGDAINKVRKSLQVGLHYWPALEREFRRFLLDLPQDRTIEEGREVVYGYHVTVQWAKTLQKVARRSFERAMCLESHSQRELKATAQAEACLRRHLIQALGHYAQKGGD